MEDSNRYGIEDLARLGGVSRRTVRYYVQEGLISGPLGLGRGSHYTAAHLRQLTAVRELQEQGRSLEDIRLILAGKLEVPPPQQLPAFRREHWIRLVFADGIELHVSSHYRLPSSTKFAELTDWFARNLKKQEEE